jgi:hypothetical protein
MVCPGAATERQAPEAASASVTEGHRVSGEAASADNQATAAPDGTAPLISLPPGATTVCGVGA